MVSVLFCFTVLLGLVSSQAPALDPNDLNPPDGINPALRAARQYMTEFGHTEYAAEQHKQYERIAGQREQLAAAAGEAQAEAGMQRSLRDEALGEARTADTQADAATSEANSAAHSALQSAEDAQRLETQAQGQVASAEAAGSEAEAAGKDKDSAEVSGAVDHALSSAQKMLEAAAKAEWGKAIHHARELVEGKVLPQAVEAADASDSAARAGVSAQERGEEGAALATGAAGELARASDAAAQAVGATEGKDRAQQQLERVEGTALEQRTREQSAQAGELAAQRTEEQAALAADKAKVEERAARGSEAKAAEAAVRSFGDEARGEALAANLAAEAKVLEQRAVRESGQVNQEEFRAEKLEGEADNAAEKVAQEKGLERTDAARARADERQAEEDAQRESDLRGKVDDDRQTEASLEIKVEEDRGEEDDASGSVTPLEDKLSDLKDKLQSLMEEDKDLVAKQQSEEQGQLQAELGERTVQAVQANQTAALVESKNAGIQKPKISAGSSGTASGSAAGSSGAAGSGSSSSSSKPSSATEQFDETTKMQLAQETMAVKEEGLQGVSAQKDINFDAEQERIDDVRRKEAKVIAEIDTTKRDLRAPKRLEREKETAAERDATEVADKKATIAKEKAEINELAGEKRTKEEEAERLTDKAAKLREDVAAASEAEHRDRERARELRTKETQDKAQAEALDKRAKAELAVVARDEARAGSAGVHEAKEAGLAKAALAKERDAETERRAKGHMALKSGILVGSDLAAEGQARQDLARTETRVLPLELRKGDEAAKATALGQKSAELSGAADKQSAKAAEDLEASLKDQAHRAAEKREATAANQGVKRDEKSVLADEGRAKGAETTELHAGQKYRMDDKKAQDLKAVERGERGIEGTMKGLEDKDLGRSKVLTEAASRKEGKAKAEDLKAMQKTLEASRERTVYGNRVVDAGNHNNAAGMADVRRARKIYRANKLLVTSDVQPSAFYSGLDQGKPDDAQVVVVANVG